MSTPFNMWFTETGKDVFGDDYLCTRISLAHGRHSDSTLAAYLSMNVYVKDSIELGIYLMCSKVRLRWLSRAVLYRLIELGIDLESFNIARSKMLCGEMTDDVLANNFFLTESEESIEAGVQRIRWLSGVLKEFSDYGDLKQDYDLSRYSCDS